MSNEKKSIIGLLLVSFIWGSAFIGVEIALKAGWGVFPILAVRGLVGGLVCLPFALKYKFWKNTKGLLSGLLMGVLYFVAFIFQTYGQDNSTVVNAAFLTVLYVAFAPLILRVFFKEKQGVKLYIGCIVSIIGVFFLTVMSSSEGLSVNFGDILVILGALFFALQIIAAQKTSKYSNAISITTIQMLTMGILSLIAMPITGQTTIKFDSSLIAVLYCAVFSSALASFVQIASQKHLNSSKASIIMGTETLFATALDSIVNKRIPSVYVFIGGFMMFLSIVIIELKVKKKMNLTKYKYVLLDIDDTLLDFQKSQNESIVNAFKDQGVDITDNMLKSYNELNVAMWKDYEKSLTTTNEIFNTRFQKLSDLYNLGCDGSKVESKFRENLNTSYYFMDGAKEFLEKIRNDYTLIVVTNGKKETQHSRLKLSGLDRYFKYIIISEEINTKKPEKEFFEYVLKNVEGFKKDEAIIIGDSLSSDIKGGNDFGIDTCFYNPKKITTENDAKYEISSFDEIILKKE